MQIIQSIREKGAAAVIAVIAVSLIGFILMDAQQGGARLFGAFSNNAGKVNGNVIETAEFNNKVKEAEDREEQQSGKRPSGEKTYQIREQVWNQIVAERLFANEAAKIGIDIFTPNELKAILLSNDQNNPLLQEKSLVGPDGRLDMAKAQEAIANIKKMKGAQREMVDAQVINPLILNTKVGKYSALLSASAYYPTWMQKREESINNNFANISYVSIPYSDISDSAVKVTDADIDAYVQKHKDLFKQEAGRGISYYSFSLLPNGEDSAAAKAAASQLIPEFTSDSSTTAFIARNSSSVDFQDKYIPKQSANNPYIDSIIKLSQGAVYGPYINNNSYVIAKYLGSKSIPDSVKARHILIVTTDRNTNQQIRDDSTAKKLADSLLAAVNSGSDFGALAMQFSADGSKDKGGDLGTFGYGAMVPEFNDFCFYKNAGERGVVQTQFGYHVIEINVQKNFNPAYKIGYVTKDIVASEYTVNQANLSATKAASHKTAKELVSYATKNALKLNSVPGIIKAADYSIPGLQDARQLVKWAFEAKKGDVSEPFNIGDQAIVAVLDKVYEEGLQDATTARPNCEAVIRNEKKSEMIIKKIGAQPTLEGAASAYGKQIQVAGADSMLTFSSTVINGLGMESKVIGASFSKKYSNATSPAIAGTSGVYVIKVNSVQSKPAATPEAAQQQVSQRQSSLRSQMNGWYESLKKLADVKDNRSALY